MHKIQFITQHIEKVYGFETITFSIPSNTFQYLKRKFYLWIYNKVSQKLFYFLRDKISPIKYLDERPRGEIWIHKRNSEGRISFEVQIRPIPVETCLYLNKDSGLFKNMDENFRVKIYDQFGDIQISFPLNHINGIEQVDYYFSKIDELKTELRNYKLKKLLK